MKKISDGVWEVEKEGKMRVPARLYATDKIKDAIEAGAFQQGKNIATLPGIQKYSIMLPDTHYGYGFPIGGVAAFDMEEGIISPGGVGYDINCGVRILTTTLTQEDVKPKLTELMDKLFRNVPSGVGSEGKLRISPAEVDEVAVQGAAWAVEHGYGEPDDLERMEENGRIQGADPAKVSDRAKKRGRPQLGTLGSGNHFLEIQRVDKIYDAETAKRFGITGENQILAMVHCGSRGYGYQICDDYIHSLNRSLPKFNIELPDRELVCAPLSSQEAHDYIGAMYCAVNYAFCNRQTIMHWIRETFMDVFGKDRDELGLDLIYDVCHNIAKFEEHDVGGETREVCVHRKGATRAFAPGRKEVPRLYQDIGQPVIIPGDMGTASYLLVGTETAMKETFGSTAHGAGRTMSRTKALKTIRGDDVKRTLEGRGQVIRATSPKVLAEESPDVYKDIDEVIRAAELAGLSKKVVRMTPMGVAKG